MDKSSRDSETSSTDDRDGSSVWLVYATRKKDSNKETMQRMVREAAVDGHFGPITVKLFYVMTTVSTPIGEIPVTKAHKATVRENEAELVEKFLAPILRLPQAKELKAEVHVERNDIETDGIAAAARRFNASRLFMHTPKFKMTTGFSMPEWVSRLPPFTTLVLVNGQLAARQCGGQPAQVVDVEGPDSRSARDSHAAPAQASPGSLPPKKDFVSRSGISFGFRSTSLSASSHSSSLKEIDKSDSTSDLAASLATSESFSDSNMTHTDSPSAAPKASPFSRIFRSSKKPPAQRMSPSASEEAFITPQSLGMGGTADARASLAAIPLQGQRGEAVDAGEWERLVSSQRGASPASAFPAGRREADAGRLAEAAKEAPPAIKSPLPQPRKEDLEGAAARGMHKSMSLDQSSSGSVGAGSVGTEQQQQRRPGVGQQQPPRAPVAVARPPPQQLSIERSASGSMAHFRVAADSWKGGGGISAAAGVQLGNMRGSGEWVVHPQRVEDADDEDADETGSQSSMEGFVLKPTGSSGSQVGAQRPSGRVLGAIPGVVARPPRRVSAPIHSASVEPPPGTLMHAALQAAGKKGTKAVPSRLLKLIAKIDEEQEKKQKDQEEARLQAVLADIEAEEEKKRRSAGGGMKDRSGGNLKESRFAAPVTGGPIPKSDSDRGNLESPEAQRSSMDKLMGVGSKSRESPLVVVGGDRVMAKGRSWQAADDRAGRDGGFGRQAWALREAEITSSAAAVIAASIPEDREVAEEASVPPFSPHLASSRSATMS